VDQLPFERERCLSDPGWSSTRINFETRCYSENGSNKLYLLVLLDLLTFVALSSSSVIDYGSLFKMLWTSNFVVSDVLHLLVGVIALFE
jgi:peptidyl-tRNA hydrolase